MCTCVLSWCLCRSAQFEHTVAITSDGVDILTKLPEESDLWPEANQVGNSPKTVLVVQTEFSLVWLMTQNPSLLCLLPWSQDKTAAVKMMKLKCKGIHREEQWRGCEVHTALRLDDCCWQLRFCSDLIGINKYNFIIYFIMLFYYLHSHKHYLNLVCSGFYSPVMGAYTKKTLFIEAEFNTCDC